MRVITKKALITFLGLFLGFATISCGGTTTTTSVSAATSTIPELSNPDSVYYSTDTYDLTYGDVYNTLKTNDGVSQLLNMVDKQLLASYISKVTDQEIADKIKSLTYGTTDDNEIAKLTAKEKADKEKAYKDSMVLLGYSGNETDYLKLVVAKENYAKEQMLSSDNSTKTWYVGPSTIASYYANSYFPDISSIKISFNSDAEAKAVMRANNLVSVNGKLMLYTGTTPLDQVPSSSLDSSNTADLSNAQLVQKFVSMYNQVYSGFKTVIPASSSVSDLIANPDLQVSYDNTNTFSASLAKLMFTSLGNYQDFTSGDNTTMFYTYKPVAFSSNSNTSYYMILNLTGTTKVDVANFKGTETELVAKIGQDLYNTIKQDLIDSNLSSSSFVANRVAELRADNDFTIYDYYLALDYEQIYGGYIQRNSGDKTKVATYGDTVITADDLLTYALNLNAPLYLMYASQLPSLLASHYSEVYCTDSSQTCDYNFMNNTSDTMQTSIAAYQNMASSFAQSQYAQYYTFENYLYLAYGATSEEDMLGKYYVRSALQPLTIYDNLSANNFAELKTLVPYINDYYDHYFNLNVGKLLIFMDRNEDGKADDYQTFYDSLTDKSAFDTKLADFKSAIDNYINEDSTHKFSSLVIAYNNAAVDDPTWGAFKADGFHISYQDMSSSGSSTYGSTVNNYDAQIVTELENLYNTYQQTDNVDKAYLLDDNLVQTTDGLNMFYVTKGTAFDKPTFKFTMTKDTSGNPLYTDGLQNPNDTYTITQLEIYAKYRLAVITTGIADTKTIYGFDKPTVPDSLLTAFNAYFADIYNAMYSVGYMNMIMCDELSLGTYKNTHPAYSSMSETTIKDRFSSIKDIYSYNILTKYDHLDK